MPIVASDIKYRLSGGAANSNPLLSIGGAKSSEDAPAGLFDTVSGAESAAGDTEYRCIYVHNNHGSLELTNPVVWIQSNTPGNRISIGIGASAVNGTETATADESTAPGGGVTFSQPANLGAGLALGSIPAGQHKAVWVRRVVAAAAAANNDSVTLRVSGDTAA
jgi:hypothetical protein